MVKTRSNKATAGTATASLAESPTPVQKTQATATPRTEAAKRAVSAKATKSKLPTPLPKDVIVLDDSSDDDDAIVPSTKSQAKSEPIHSLDTESEGESLHSEERSKESDPTSEDEGFVSANEDLSALSSADDSDDDIPSLKRIEEPLPPSPKTRSRLVEEMRIDHIRYQNETMSDHDSDTDEDKCSLISTMFW
jgi:hypothetical protein